MGLVQTACHKESSSAPDLWNQAVTALPENTTLNSPTQSAPRVSLGASSQELSATTSPQNGSFSHSATASITANYENNPATQIQRVYPGITEESRPVYAEQQYFGGSVRLAQVNPITLSAAPAPSAKVSDSTATAEKFFQSTSPSGGENSAAGGTVARSSVSQHPVSQSSGMTASTANSEIPGLKAPAPSGNGTSVSAESKTGPATPTGMNSQASGESATISAITEIQPEAMTAGESEQQTPGFQAPTQDAEFGRFAKSSGDGILGSSVEPVVLPSVGALYATLFGQPESFEQTSPRNLDYNVWFLDGPEEQYEQYATARIYLKKVFLQEEKIPAHPDCSSKKLDSGRIEVTCDGKFPLADGMLLRLIVCGKPNPEVLDKYSGDAENPLADFIDQAYVHGDPNLADKELCSDRRFIDYEFKGPDMEIRFPLETGFVYFISQFPLDYLKHQDVYGPPTPNKLGIHNRTYPDSKAMGHFLVNARILQVVVAAPRAEAKDYNAKPGQKSLNYSYARSDFDPIIIGRAPSGVPDNEYCQQVSEWDESFSQKEWEILRMINQQRSQGADCGESGTFEAAPPLLLDTSMKCAARRHSLDMAENDYFSHYDPSGQSEWERIWVASTQALFSGEPKTPRDVFLITGENIAKGASDPDAIVKEWLKSDEHCANLMNPMFTHMGAGFYQEEKGAAMATLNFGTEWK